jgi:enoyl-CoA hydratase
MSEQDPLRVERASDGVATITLTRPERLNAVSTAMVNALFLAVVEIAADDSVGAIVIAGEGKAFCAGADISELDSLDGPVGFASFVRRMTDAYGALARCPKPSVAALHGAVLGGGLELALACDLRIADDTVKLGVPEIRLGLLPAAGGSARLPRCLPPGTAKMMLLTGDALGAAEAHRVGLVNEIVPVGTALSVATVLARRLAALPPLALAAAKRLADDGPSMPLEAAIALERETVSVLFGTQDRVDGVRAFLERRPASFSGR